MNLSTAPTKTPPLEKDGILNHIWQRWFSDLYEKIKELEKNIDELKGKK